MSEIFTHKQKECLRLLRDYAVYFAMDERYNHECKYHDNKHACEMHISLLKEMDRLKKEAEVCGQGIYGYDNILEMGKEMKKFERRGGK